MSEERTAAVAGVLSLSLLVGSLASAQTSPAPSASASPAPRSFDARSVSLHRRSRATRASASLRFSSPKRARRSSSTRPSRCSASTSRRASSTTPRRVTPILS